MSIEDTSSTPRDDAHSLSLRERKKHLAQTTIEETALRLFQQRGYEQTSIQDIADAVMMSPRTFFRYFASKEEVLFVPMRTAQREARRALERVPPTTSPHAALGAMFEFLASLYQQQGAQLLIRYQVALRTPSVIPMYLYVLLQTELAICDALSSHLEAAPEREIRVFVAIYMAALRVAVEEWLEQGATGDLVASLRDHLDHVWSLPHGENE